MGEAGVAQLVEHQPSKLRVAGSNPVSRSSAHVAQAVERFLGKDEVTGPNPVMGSKLNVVVKFCKISNGRNPQFNRIFQTGISVGN